MSAKRKVVSLVHWTRTPKIAHFLVSTENGAAVTMCGRTIKSYEDVTDTIPTYTNGQLFIVHCYQCSKKDGLIK